MRHDTRGFEKALFKSQCCFTAGHPQFKTPRASVSIIRFGSCTRPLRLDSNHRLSSKPQIPHRSPLEACSVDEGRKCIILKAALSLCGVFRVASVLFLPVAPWLGYLTYTLHPVSQTTALGRCTPHLRFHRGATTWSEKINRAAKTRYLMHLKLLSLLGAMPSMDQVISNPLHKPHSRRRVLFNTVPLWGSPEVYI
ncbi:hypothetical protein BC826DRAFT_353689 [Russula brevipes]|nr:hypothetical protein BC826DRAFT_353689 [Russula brevipes]